MNALPLGWRLSRFGEEFDIQGGSQPPKSKFVYSPKNGYIRLLQIRDFGESPVPTYVPENLVTKTCNENDIFIARYGASLGRIVTGMSGAYNVALAKVIPKKNIERKYLYYLLHTPFFQDPIKLLSRSAQNGFNKAELDPIELPIAPIDLQQKIVNKIDSLFAEIDKGVAELEKAKKNLELYRQSVLNAAVRGKLVPQDPNDEPASVLLSRIREEKEKLIAEGKIKKEKPLPPIDPDEVPFELPKGWEWVRLGEIAHTCLGKMLDKAKNKGTPRPYLRNINVRWFTFDTTDLLEMKFEQEELERFSILKGDLAMCEGGEPGRCAVWDMDEPIYFQKAIHRIRPYCKIDPYYIAFVIRAGALLGTLSRYYTGTGIMHLVGEQLKNYPVPLPPLKEIKRISTSISDYFNNIETLEDTISQTLNSASTLKQSILKSAFEGKLV